MSDLAKTITAVVLAALLVGGVWLTRPSHVTSVQFSDEGQPFFAAFTDPLAARSFEVVAFDESAATYKPFKVEFDGKRWLIPSHNNYPADAQQRMGEAASAFIGLKKEQVVADSASTHQALGVLAPDEDAAPLTGRGTRVTIKDDQGRVLSDLILGKPVPAQPGEAGASANRRYVRIPGHNRVYAASLDKTFSTKFADWVETDLLRLAAGDAGTVAIDRVEVDRYSIDESTGRQKDGETLVVSRAAAPAAAAQPPAAPPAWTLQATPGGPPGLGETVNTTRVDELVNTLRDLKIVGVRPKPANLAAVLGGASESGAITMADQLSLQSRGFYLTKKGQLLANDGQLNAYSNDGVVYTIWFGELLIGQGDEISAGAEPAKKDAAKDASKDPAKPASDAPKGQESRYIFITVKYDDSIIPAPEAPKPKTPPAPPKPADSASTNEGDKPAAKPTDSQGSSAADAPPAPVVDEKEQAEYQSKLAARNGKVESGKKRAEMLSRRFADWYYVIDAASVKKLQPTRAELIQAAKPAQTVGPTPTLPAAPPPNQ